MSQKEIALKPIRRSLRLQREGQHFNGYVL